MNGGAKILIEQINASNMYFRLYTWSKRSVSYNLRYLRLVVLDPTL